MAANAGAIKAGKAFVEFVLSDKKIKAQLRNLQSNFSSIGQGLRKVGAVGLAVGGTITSAFAGAAKIFADAGSRLADMSARTGLSVESLSELDHAATQTGTSLEAVEMAAKHLQKEGIDPKLFDEYADSISAIEDPTKRAQKAMEVFGKKVGASLLPMLADLQKLRKEARELGLVMSSEDAAAADTLGDSLDTLWEQLKMVVVQVGAAIAGPLTNFLNLTKPILKGVIDWVKNNRSLVATVAAVGVGIAGLGALLVATGVGFSLIGVAIGGFITAASVVGTVLGAIFSPIGLLIATLAAGVVAWAKFTSSGQAAVASLVSSFGWLKDTVLTSVSAISTALAAGDIAAAGKVLWSTLKLLWLQGTDGLRETWATMTGGIAKAWHVTWAGVMQLANSVWGNLERGWSHTTENIRNGWSHTVEFMSTFWDTTMAALKQSWNGVVAFFQTTWLRLKSLFGADVADEIDRINKELEAANHQIDVDVANRAASRNAAASGDRERASATADAAREKSRTEQAATLDVVGKELADKLAATDAGTKEKIAAAQKQLEDARNEWKNATTAAQALEGDPKKAEQMPTSAGVQATLDKAFSRGTFNASNLLALAAPPTGPAEETAKNTARLVKLEERKARAGGAELTVQ